MVTAGTRWTILAASESGDFLMTSALTVSLTTALFLRSVSWVASAALFACATTSTTCVFPAAICRLASAFVT